MVGQVLQRFLLILALLDNGPDFVPLAQYVVDDAPGIPGFRCLAGTAGVGGKKKLHPGRWGIPLCETAQAIGIMVRFMPSGYRW